MLFWILRTGAPWGDLFPDYGDWKNTHRRFCRWRDKSVWKKFFEVLNIKPDYEWLMIDASHCKVNPWREIATRYAKWSSSFFAAVQIWCILLWVNII